MINIEPLLQQIQNRKPVVIVVPLVLGLFVGGVLVVKPGLTRLGGVKAEIASLQQKISTFNFVRESESKLGAYKNRFSKDQTWLIDQINSIAEQSGLSILSSLPEGSGRVGDFLVRNPVRIEAEAGYHQLGSFVGQLESLDAYVKIFSLEINASSGGAGVPLGPGPGQVAAPRAVRPQGANLYKITMSIGLFTPADGAL